MGGRGGRSWLPSCPLFEDADGVCSIWGALSTWDGLSWSSGRDGSCPLLVASTTPCQVCGLRAGGAHGLVTVVLALSGPVGWPVVQDGGSPVAAPEGRGRLICLSSCVSKPQPCSPQCPSSGHLPPSLGTSTCTPAEGSPSGAEEEGAAVCAQTPSPALLHAGVEVGQTSIMRFVAPRLWEQTPPPQAPCLARGGVGDRRPAHRDPWASRLLAALPRLAARACPPGLRAVPCAAPLRPPAGN